MNLIKLSEIFDIYNGLLKSSINVFDTKIDEDYIPYIRPSHSLEGSVDGYVNKKTLNKEKIFKKGTIYISKDGEGSHTYSYLSVSEFVPNSNVLVAIPKIELSLMEKLFYAKCIMRNRFKFCYSRKPKESRVKNLLIPSKSSIPKWLSTIKLPEKPKSKPLHKATLSLHDREYKWFTLGSLFHLSIGTETAMNADLGDIPLISSKDGNNGVSSFISDGKKIFPKNSITIANNGSVGASFYQNKNFFATADITILNNIKFNKFNTMFIITIIKNEGYRFSYGRKWGIARMKKSKIKLPVTTKGDPDWQFMENYIKSLPYSSALQTKPETNTRDDFLLTGQKIQSF